MLPCKKPGIALPELITLDLAAFLLIFLTGHFCLAAAPAKEPHPGQDKPWSFGHSLGRHDPLWQSSNGMSNLMKKTRPGKMAEKTGAVDTTGGIGRALDVAMPKVRTNLSGKAKKVESNAPKGNVGMSMANESSSWKVNPGEMRIDEYMPRANRHAVRAYAGVKAGDDFDIKVGPELHLRDESKGVDGAQEKQPDSSLGVGMSFKLDF